MQRPSMRNHLVSLYRVTKSDSSSLDTLDIFPLVGNRGNGPGEVRMIGSKRRISLPDILEVFTSDDIQGFFKVCTYSVASWGRYSYKNKWRNNVSLRGECWSFRTRGMHAATTGLFPFMLRLIYPIIMTCTVPCYFNGVKLHTIR